VHCHKKHLIHRISSLRIYCLGPLVISRLLILDGLFFMLLLRGGIRCVEHWIIFLPRLWRDVLTMKWLIFGVWGCCCMISWLELLRLRLRVILLPTERSLVWILIFLQGLPLMPRILYEIFFKKILIRECHLSSFPSILGY
jgi:hypothetical protein